jgi:hypothetical protein
MKKISELKVKLLIELDRLKARQKEPNQTNQEMSSLQGSVMTVERILGWIK